MLVYLNSQIVPIEEARISAVDHGFLYGVGLFETMRVYNRRMFLWERHLDRLKQGLDALQIRLPWTDQELLQAVEQTVDANGLRDAYVRLDITAGPEGLGLIAEGYTRPTLLVYAKPVPPIAEPPSSKKLQIVSIPRQTVEGKQRYKSHTFVNNVLAKLEVGSDPGVEGLFLTTEGFVCEGIVSNIFWVKHNRLYTPALSTGILAGITRSFVIDLACEQGLEVREGEYVPEALRSADEAFLTNSIQEIVPVSHINQSPLTSTGGPITLKLRQAYRQSVELLG
ncbi:aminodeoxychorismate lyase [Brevibacillus humidisoli]|uniref:aminodeoxychorismate lyase n=1 Tax=Brevibacillus humidisoli TaxID=2895522 RepID=UPI001E5875B8|nr:aminodeoxychorismate lyase [Brevibacillus humidisoli]UFJ43409.1 aminodeoxychorismate lyase [Brevibacillus humidisoli]